MYVFSKNLKDYFKKMYLCRNTQIGGFSIEIRKSKQASKRLSKG